MTPRFNADLRGDNVKPLPKTLTRLAETSLKIPAGKSATLPVLIDPSVDLGYGLYGAICARVVATSNDGRTVVTPLGSTSNRSTWMSPSR